MSLLRRVQRNIAHVFTSPLMSHAPKGKVITDNSKAGILVPASPKKEKSRWRTPNIAPWIHWTLRHDVGKGLRVVVHAVATTHAARELLRLFRFYLLPTSYLAAQTVAFDLLYTHKKEDELSRALATPIDEYFPTEHCENRQPVSRVTIELWLLRHFINSTLKWPLFILGMLELLNSVHLQLFSWWE